MKLRRRNFIQITALLWATVISGLSLRANPKKRDSQLAVSMMSDDGDYAVRVDGHLQILRIIDNVGEVSIPQYSCTLEYTPAIGTSDVTVYIDQGTTMSYLAPAKLLAESGSKWEVTLMGNPVANGKIITNITGPSNKMPVLEVTDISGRSLVKKQVSKTKFSQDFELDIQRYAKGTLLFTVSCDDFSETMKVFHDF
ncbi:T9SS type A sorting domain-containing protein [Dyadobacter sandarakinus]|uniref:T9SS type A sorting domain-containing protein n=1 Tax=Dyadobacter sandarakinus TaxID=2747268 RepID=A0ABX7I0C3_9BACT|nr:T9SS type A sorting domain-containing protein [Dyadobacter sandarakinus]QRQ99460.1 T9SS type A sorting domain-containing protein [Dyadobacter sandarakinus]